MIVLIPAYEPDDKLVDLVRTIAGTAPELRIVVADDGSGAAYRAFFESAVSAGASLLRHDPNRGKGFTLKEGFAYAAAQHPGEPVVCADCDGQHRVPDIQRVADRVASAGPRAMILGSRRFTGPVPARSRFGNALTRRLFRATSGVAVHDTQTGLRAYSPDLLDWLQTVPGDRFEYELELLLRARDEGVSIVEVPIDTVYLAGNESSHFRPVQDSVRVYAPMVRHWARSVRRQASAVADRLRRR